MFELYDVIELYGEGQYGIVYKCAHKQTGKIVAIKKFKDSKLNPQCVREVQILKNLSHHDNIVNLIDFFFQKGKLHLVFEFVNSSLLKEIQKDTGEMSELIIKRYIFQLLKAIEHLHENNIIHRDIKPENLLISEHGILKLCDFGFARPVNGIMTEYVSTRWYRAPELLVGDVRYGKEVDVWAIGSILIECLTGIPLFQGRSDLDQLSKIVKCFGKLTSEQMEQFYEKYGQKEVSKLNFPEMGELNSLRKRFFSLSKTCFSFIEKCLNVEPKERSTVFELLDHPYLSECKEWYHSSEFQQTLEKDQLHKKVNEQLCRMIKRGKRGGEKRTTTTATTTTMTTNSNNNNNNKQQQRNNKNIERVFDELVNNPSISSSTTSTPTSTIINDHNEPAKNHLNHNHNHQHHQHHEKEEKVSLTKHSSFLITKKNKKKSNVLILSPRNFNKFHKNDKENNNNNNRQKVPGNSSPSSNHSSSPNISPNISPTSPRKITNSTSSSSSTNMKKNKRKRKTSSNITQIIMNNNNNNNCLSSSPPSNSLLSTSPSSSSSSSPKSSSSSSSSPNSKLMNHHHRRGKNIRRLQHLHQHNIEYDPSTIVPPPFPSSILNNNNSNNNNEKEQHRKKNVISKRNLKKHHSRNNSFDDGFFESTSPSAPHEFSIIDHSHPHHYHQHQHQHPSILNLDDEDNNILNNINNNDSSSSSSFIQGEEFDHKEGGDHYNKDENEQEQFEQEQSSSSMKTTNLSTSPSFLNQAGGIGGGGLSNNNKKLSKLKKQKVDPHFKIVNVLNNAKKKNSKVDMNNMVYHRQQQQQKKRRKRRKPESDFFIYSKDFNDVSEKEQMFYRSKFKTGREKKRGRKNQNNYFSNYDYFTL